MTLESRVTSVAKSKHQRDEIIAEYINFILSCASKTLKRYVTFDDDVFSVALIAFDEAMVNFDSSKGSFLSFAAWVIKHRIIDFERKEQKYRKNIPFSSLAVDDGDGDEFTFDAEDRKNSLTDTALELRFLTHELEKYSITLEDLSKAAPKFASTKEECAKVIKYIVSSSEMTSVIMQKKTLPVKRLISELGVGEKLLERHRKYIIAAVVILSGEYEHISKMI